MSDRINVLMMVSSYWQGAEKFIGGNFHFDQAVSLSEYCNCAIYYPYDKSLNVPFTDTVDRGIRTFRSKYALEKKLRNRRYMVRAMKYIIKEYHPDIIHGNVATEAGRFAVALGKLFKIPVLVSEHSAIEASGVEYFPHYYYAKIAYENCDYITCVSDDLTRKLGKIFPRCEFHTVYNGIVEPDNKLLMNVQKRYRKEGAVNMVVVAAFYDSSIKGIQFLLPALKRLLSEGRKVALHLVGGGEYLSYFKQMAQKLEITQNCIFYDHCSKEQVYEIVSEMDFMVSSSLFESFGCSIAEGMMMGKPAVATRSGGIESIVNDETGILVEKGSEEELYQGIKTMAENYKKFSSERISYYAHEKFLIGMISRRYMDIYQEILN